jgi:hypothetical protein
MIPNSDFRNKALVLSTKIIPGFRNDEFLSPVFDKLVSYFTVKQRKGIILMGKVGTGKTSLMRIFDQFARLWFQNNMFILHNVKEIERAYSKDGQAGFDRIMYSKSPWLSDPNMGNYYNICIDDIGIEGKVNHFRNSIEPAEEIIFSRYELFITKGVITHFTTNLDANDLKERYSNRNISRLREMCHVIYLKGDDRRK